MANNIKLAVATRNAMGDAIIAALGNGALLDIYDGTQPAGPGTAVTTQTKLGTLTGGTPYASATASGVITANALTQDSSADATGTASWYRLKTSGGTAIMDGSVGTSGADLNLNTVSIVAAGPISVSSLTHTMPGG